MSILRRLTFVEEGVIPDIKFKTRGKEAPYTNGTENYSQELVVSINPLMTGRATDHTVVMSDIELISHYNDTFSNQETQKRSESEIVSSSASVSIAK